ncbi:MAG: S41 family peptidase, partial [Candidatus Binatia bacterium]
MNHFRRKTFRKVLFGLSGLVLLFLSSGAHAIPEKIYRSLDLFSKVLFLVDRDYVESVDGQDLVYGAIKGMLLTLDPYSLFLTPDVYKELKVDTMGRFGGVGLEITLQKGILTVVTPIEDSPAARAGVQPGDRIIRINGVITKGMNLADAVRRMRGGHKTKVTLTLFREGVAKPFDVTLHRETIKIKSVRSDLMEGSIGYLRLNTFQEHSREEFEKAVEEMEKKSGGLKGLIVDLRNNPGGLLDQAIEISDLFLKSGVIVSTRGRTAQTDIRSAKA